MDRVNIHIDQEQRERLRMLAERKGVSMAELIRRAIEALLAKEEKRGESKKAARGDQA